jgi:hypothetical protein
MHKLEANNRNIGIHQKKFEYQVQIEKWQLVDELLEAVRHWIGWQASWPHPESEDAVKYPII